MYSYSASSVVQTIPEHLTQMSWFYLVNQSLLYAAFLVNQIYIYSYSMTGVFWPIP